MPLCGPKKTKKEKEKEKTHNEIPLNNHEMVIIKKIYNKCWRD